MRLQILTNRWALSAASAMLCFALAGCGGNTNNRCFIESIIISPVSAIADHTAAPPGSTQQFAAFPGAAPQGCAVAQSNLTNVIWSVSDPVNVSIGSTPGPSNGLATCNAATTGAVTVTGTLNQTDFAPVKATASLTCN